ncbi:MAG: HD domain-containing protein [Bdellovibrionales bacterium]|nr:HD domain-containing protein [Bdellovibrionales bacterium]
MEIRDVIHGAILLEDWELPVVDSRYFQRLRHIKQLGFAEFSFPSATHNRYIHSLGAMHTASQAFQSIFRPYREKDFTARFLAVTRLAALLHDIGHGPLSHTTEFAMPLASALKVPGLPPSQAADEQATHEHYTLKIVLDSGLTPILQEAGRRFGFGPKHIAGLIEPEITVDDDFFHVELEGQRVDFRPLLQQLISSELDADRMDYLRRDSNAAGVSYGHFDFNWLVGNLTSHIAGGKCFLALQHRALFSFEDFLISRYHMFLMVYFHYKSVIYDEMLQQYLRNPDCGYRLPADVEAYCESTDAQLFGHLGKSSNEWARRIVEKRPYRILVELHSGIPATRRAKDSQDRLYDELIQRLRADGTPFLTGKSTGELSKYYRKLSKNGETARPIFVRYDNHYSAPEFIPLDKCTDLFERYSERRSIRRIYVSPEDYRKLRAGGRGAPLRYEDSAEDDSLPLSP